MSHPAGAASTAFCTSAIKPGWSSASSSRITASEATRYDLFRSDEVARVTADLTGQECVGSRELVGKPCRHVEPVHGSETID